MAARRSCAEETSRRVVEIYEFFRRYRCLADAYSIGVFTEDHWSHVVPDEWKKELAVISDHLFLQPWQLPDGNLGRLGNRG